MVFYTGLVFVMGIAILLYIAITLVSPKKEKREQETQFNFKKRVLMILQSDYRHNEEDNWTTKTKLMERLQVENPRLFFMTLKELEKRSLIVINDEIVQLTEFGYKFYMNFLATKDDQWPLF